MTQFERVSPAVEQAWLGLADRIRRSLGEVIGLPVSDGVTAGVEISADTGADEAGGVFVAWKPSTELTDRSTDSVALGRLDDPSIRLSGRVKQIMADALRDILGSSGFVTEPADEDMRPYGIRVTGERRAEALLPEE